MTNIELKSLIISKLAGQGNQVDCASTLPSILISIIDSFSTTKEIDDFEEFSPSTPYSSGDIVRYNGLLYEFINSHSGAWVVTDVKGVNILSLLDTTIHASMTPSATEEGETATKADICEEMGITTAQFDAMFRMEISRIIAAGETYPILAASSTRVAFGYFISDDDKESFVITKGSGDSYTITAE